MGENKGHKCPLTHLAIILDGNRRWARKNKLQTFSGHHKGGEVLDNIINFCINNKIKILTIYALSSRNLSNRSKEELAVHFSLHKKYIKRDLKSKRYKKDGIRFNVLGRIHNLPEDEQKLLKEAMGKSRNYKKFVLNTCLAYDGQEEIVDAVKSIVNQGIKQEEINEELIKKNLYTAEFPPPDLIIRTGMNPEQRLSGFLLWDSSYAELHFTKTLWPDFTIEELKEILKNYQQRGKRNGG